MTIEERPNGKYRIKISLNGKRYSVTFDHKPTEGEVFQKLSTRISDVIECEHITFETAANEYCKLKKNVLSPKTYREYMMMPKRLSKEFNNLYIDKITDKQLQKEINDLAATRKPKTVKNYYDFIVPVIRMYRDDFRPKVTVPEVMQELLYIPTDEEVHKLFEAAQNHTDGMFFIPIVLGSYGLRRSEICALTPDDFIDNVVYVRKSKVQTYEDGWIIKEYPKNSTSIRRIPIDPEIVALIKEQGYVYEGHPNSISDFISKFCDRNNVRHFSLHKLRHYFCSRLIAENVDVKTTISMSGHKTDAVMKRIYLHSVDEKVQEASDKLEQILFKGVSKCPNNSKE